MYLESEEAMKEITEALLNDDIWPTGDETFKNFENKVKENEGERQFPKLEHKDIIKAFTDFEETLNLAKLADKGVVAAMMKLAECADGDDDDEIVPEVFDGFMDHFKHYYLDDKNVIQRGETDNYLSSMLYNFCNSFLNGKGEYE